MPPSAHSSLRFFSLRELPTLRAPRARALPAAARAPRHASSTCRVSSGRPVPVTLAVFSAVLNLMSAVLFLEDVVKLGSVTGQEFKELITDSVAEAAKPNISNFFPFLSALDFSHRRRGVTANLNRFYEFFDAVIDRRLSSREEPDDLLESLLKLNDKSQLERPVIRALYRSCNL